MTMMRQNPLPVGTYVVDVFAEQWGHFRNWLQKHGKTVRVDRIDTNEQSGETDASGQPARKRYLFTVSGPTPWNGPGFPSIATEHDTLGADEPGRVMIPLIEGEQVWHLYATDKFGLSAEDLITDSYHGLGVALRAILSQAKGQTGDVSPWQEITTGSKEYRIGNARPIQVVSVDKKEPGMPAGKTIADRNSYAGDGIPTVVGQEPWHVVIRFWWRSPNEGLPWPAFTSLFPALPDLKQVNGAEWVLAKAVVPTQKTKDPGDVSWGGAQKERVKTELGNIGGAFAKVGMGIVVVGVVGVAGYFAFKSFVKSRASGNE